VALVVAWAASAAVWATLAAALAAAWVALAVSNLPEKIYKVLVALCSKDFFLYKYHFIHLLSKNISIFAKELLIGALLTK
jgi:hypothetical protein